MQHKEHKHQDTAAGFLYPAVLNISAFNYRVFNTLSFLSPFCESCLGLLSRAGIPRIAAAGGNTTSIRLWVYSTQKEGQIPLAAQHRYKHRERFHLKRWLGYKQHQNSPQGSTLKTNEKIQMLKSPGVSYSDSELVEHPTLARCSPNGALPEVTEKSTISPILSPTAALAANSHLLQLSRQRYGTH